MLSLFSNVCRSLFEKHKLHFAFLVCARIRMNDDSIDAIEWRHLLSAAEPMQVRNAILSSKNKIIAWLDLSEGLVSILFHARSSLPFSFDPITISNVNVLSVAVRKPKPVYAYVFD